MIERGAAHRAEPLIGSGGRRQALAAIMVFHCSRTERNL
jgi:hypothetical protein